MSVEINKSKKGKFISKKQFGHSEKRRQNILKARYSQQSSIFYHDYASKFHGHDSSTNVEDRITNEEPGYVGDSPVGVGKLKPVDFFRFIVDFKSLIEQLYCQVCENDLSLKNTAGVLPSGVCGHLVVKCLVCEHVNKVAMGKTHQEPGKPGPKIFDVNSKLGTELHSENNYRCDTLKRTGRSKAIYHIEIGPTQANNFLTTLNLPSVNVKTFRRRCEEVGDEIQKLAEYSVQAALKEESIPSAKDHEIFQQIGSNSKGRQGETIAISKEDARKDDDHERFQQIGSMSKGRHGETIAISTEDAGKLKDDDHERFQQIGSMSKGRHGETIAISTEDAGKFKDDDHERFQQIGSTSTRSQGETTATLTEDAGTDDVDGRLLPMVSREKEKQRETILLTKNKENDSKERNHQSDTGITVSADGTFQKRGSGRCYNSLSGAASLIGKKTGKIVGFSSRSKRCRICMHAKKLNKTPRSHKCRKNWVGSAKAMEPDMIVEMLHHASSAHAPVCTLIGDDDSTAFKRAREEVNTAIEKVSDKNHIKKNLSNQLYQLKSRYPKDLSVKTINALLKSFNYMIAQNTGKEEEIKRNLTSVVLHQFGEHETCGNWCALKENPPGKHKNLPWGLDLHNNSLKKDLLHVFSKLDPSKLCRLDSSNANESFNNILRSKAPKDKHYSESSSLTHRISAAVCLKNEGYGYVAKVHEKLGLSPGNSTISRANVMDKEVQRKRTMCRDKKYKRRRIQLKVERSEGTKSCELREGDTYAANIMVFKFMVDKNFSPQTRVLKNYVPKKSLLLTENLTRVYFDLETTGLSKQSSIIQLAASVGASTFSKYVTPMSNISPEASKVTGITFDGKILYYQGKEVAHHHPVNSLLDFIAFLSENGKGVYLAAHNCRNFDAVILYNQLRYYNLWGEFCKTVIGFADTLALFKIMYPECVKKITNKKH